MIKLTPIKYSLKFVRFLGRNSKNALVIILLMVIIGMNHTFKSKEETLSYVVEGWEECSRRSEIEQYMIFILQRENNILQNLLKNARPPVFKVKVTMYHPVSEQTDDTPNITADGSVIRIEKASSYRYIAVSRDLLKINGGEYDYGDYVILYGTGIKDGVYQIRDTMNKRWKLRIDILESPSVHPYKFNEAFLVKVDNETINN